jgi:site-specific DNA-methyltransferase (adenine-specific)
MLLHKSVPKSISSGDIVTGNCLDVLDLISEDSIDLIVTSPPYNLSIKYDTYEDCMPYGYYLNFLRQVWMKSYRVLKFGGRICINVPTVTVDGILRPLFSDVIQQMLSLGFIFRNEIIWHKDQISNRTAWGSWASSSDPKLCSPYEYILVFSKGSTKLQDSSSLSDITASEFIKFTNSMWNVSPSSSKNHPAIFPEEIAYRLIKLYSYVGHTVLDPFSGSGTTISVAYKNGRKYIGSDLSYDYNLIAYNRLLDAKESLKLDCPNILDFF